MRILLVYPSVDVSIVDVATGIQAGLEAEGHTVVPYRLSRRLQLVQRALEARLPAGQELRPETASLYASEGLPYRAITEGCRWTLVVGGAGLHPNALWALRRIGARVAIWFTEAPYDSTDERELHLAELADLALVNERSVVADFQRAQDRAGAGGQAHYLRHAYNPAVHRPGEPQPEHICDVLFVGTAFPDRQALLEAVDWTGIDLRLGGIWLGLGGSESPHRLAGSVRYGCLDNRELARLYHGARVVINPHRYHPTAESANPRTFEAAACGAFQISDRRAEVVELFGEAVPTYEPGVPWQLGALVRRYLADEPERRRLAELARERVQGETFQARARQIVEAMADYEARR